MQHVLSTHLFVRHRLTTVWLERIWAAGFRAVEIFCARPHFEYQGAAQLGELRHWFRDSELKLHSLHAPIFSDDAWGRSGPNAVIDITEPVKARRFSAVDQIKRAIEVAEHVPFRYLVQHLGVLGQEMDERRWDAGFGALEEIKVFAGQRGVEVLLENIPNGLSTAERLHDFLATTHLNLGYCFDIGHAHLARGVANEFGVMRERTRSVHVHDNKGDADDHLPPGEGTVNWREALRLCGALPLVLELSEPAAGWEHPVEEARRAVAQLDEIASRHE